MDSLGNKTDEHENCGGELIRHSVHDAYYCTGCGEWVEDVCGALDCGFCKDRPVKPEIEHPKCKKCGGVMRMGKALQNTIRYGIPDFVGQKDNRGQIFSLTGPPVLISVLKCVRCGYSVTP